MRKKKKRKRRKERKKEKKKSPVWIGLKQLYMKTSERMANFEVSLFATVYNVHVVQWCMYLQYLHQQLQGRWGGGGCLVFGGGWSSKRKLIINFPPRPTLQEFPIPSVGECGYFLELHCTNFTRLSQSRALASLWMDLARAMSSRSLTLRARSLELWRSRFALSKLDL